MKLYVVCLLLLSGCAEGLSDPSTNDDAGQDVVEEPSRYWEPAIPIEASTNQNNNGGGNGFDIGSPSFDRRFPR